MSARCWRFVALFFLFVCSVREASALAITAGAPVVTQTGEAAWSLGDAAANAIASASRAWATDGLILSATDGVAMAGLGGELALTVTEGASASSAFGAIGACIASVVCGVAAAATVGALAVALRMRAHGDGTSVDGDPGQPLSNVAGVVWSSGDVGGACSNEGSASAAAQCHIDSFVTPNLGQGDSASLGACAAWADLRVGCSFTLTGPDYGGGATYNINVSGTQGTVRQCPALPDGSVPAPGLDGLCPTGNYVPMTNDDVAARLRAAGGLGTAQVAQAAEASVDVGGMAMSATSSKISGPGTQVGPTTQTSTTTSVDAHGNATTSTTSVTPTYTYTYGNTGVTATTSTTTTTQNSDGSSTSTTTGPAPGTSTGTGTGTGTSTGTGGSPNTDTEGLCAEYPDVLACDKFGEPPTDTVPTSSINAPTYAPESVSLPESCPSPAVVDGKSFSYQPICDAATNARPWVLIGAAFTALMMIVAVVRTM